MLTILQLTLVGILGVLVIINIIRWCQTQTRLEGYEWQGQLALKPFTDVAKHVRLNKFRRPVELSTRPPLPRTGEKYCVKADCPHYLERDTTCWFCY